MKRDIPRELGGPEYNPIRKFNDRVGIYAFCQCCGTVRSEHSYPNEFSNYIAGTRHDSLSDDVLSDPSVKAFGWDRALALRDFVVIKDADIGFTLLLSWADERTLERMKEPA